MGHPFEQRSHAEVPASPDEVWAAIASGPGIDSWFMGHSEVQPGASGTVRTVFGEYAPELDVTTWDPARRFAYRSGEAPDGRFIAYEFLIEARAGGSTVLRTVTSGFLPGDDWADEFEAMTLGGEMYFRTLVEYLSSLRGPVRGAGHRVRAAGHDLDPRPGVAVPRPRPARGRRSPATRPDSAQTMRSAPWTASSTSPMPTRSAYARRTRSTGSCAASASRRSRPTTCSPTARIRPKPSMPGNPGSAGRSPDRPRTRPPDHQKRGIP